MTEREVHLTQEAYDAALSAMDISAINGLVGIAIVLKKRGLITANELKDLHDSMSKPLSLPINAGNPILQDAQSRMDDLFATLLGNMN